MISIKRHSLVSPFYTFGTVHITIQKHAHPCVINLISHSANVNGLLGVRHWSRHLGSARADKDSLVELTCEGRDRQ